MEIVFESWFLIAVAATAVWGLSCVVDVYFVGNGVFRDAIDGVVVAGLFCVVPAVAILAVTGIGETSIAIVLVSALAAGAFLLHMLFYMRALFASNDAANAEIFNTLSVLVVPALAFVILGEQLEPAYYGAIAVAATGILVLLRTQVAQLKGATLVNLLASVLFVSLMMVLQAWVLERTDFGTAAFLFSVASFLFVVGLLALRRARRRRTADMCRQFGAVFVVLQVLELGAVLAVQRATDLAPSVSLVALVECSLPLFVIAFGALGGRVLAWADHPTTVDGGAALTLQTTALPSKVTAMLLIMSSLLVLAE